MKLAYFSAPTVLNLHQDILNAVMCVGILHTHCLKTILANLVRNEGTDRAQLNIYE